MIIAAHCSGVPDSLSKLIPILARNTQHHFIVFTDDTATLEIAPQENLEIILVSIKPSNFFLLQYWYNHQMCSLLKKRGVHLFLTQSSLCSHKSAIPQIMLLQKIIWRRGTEHQPAILKRRLSPITLSSFRKASAICPANNALAAQLRQHVPAFNEKMHTIGHGRFFKPATGTSISKENIRLAFSDGHPYLLAQCLPTTGAYMLPLLKAFSIFKKRMKTGMRLVIINRMKIFPVENFSGYKFKDEVRIENMPDEAAERELIAAAYAAFDFSAEVPVMGFAMACIESLVPVAINTSQEATDIFADAVIQFEPTTVAIAELMMNLYRDETYYKRYAENARNFAAKLDWDAAAARLLQVMENAKP